MTAVLVCRPCARRTWLLTRLAGHLEVARARIDELLALDDDALIEAVAGDERAAVRRAVAEHDPATAAATATRAGLTAVCRCQDEYPDALRDLPGPPAVLHVGGGVERLNRYAAERPVAVVGARRPSAYGRDTARWLAGELARAGVTILSGMAMGIDGAAHDGALGVGGATIAVLAGGADVAYPPSQRRLHARIRERGVVVSELGPGVRPRRWMFPARNRIIAALAAATIVVQARERSGALLTAEWARRLDRTLGAVPGQVSAPLSAGPHALLRDGATLVTGAQDVLDSLYGVGVVGLAAARPAPAEPELAVLLEAIADGEEGEAAFARAGLAGAAGFAALAQLELDGYVRRAPGGRYAVRR
jgi:DNA processing protein